MPIDREALISWYRRNRRRSEAFFDRLPEEIYTGRPIELRLPFVFYEGHLPAFSFNTLVKKALGGPSLDPDLEALFARGIDPPDFIEPEGGHGRVAPGAGERQEPAWPARAAVKQFAAEVDRRVIDALANADLDRPGDPLLDRAEAAFTILEHEPLHHETLLYMWHRVPPGVKTPPPGYAPRLGKEPAPEWIEIPAGRATLGVDRGSIPFGWDNEFPSCLSDVETFAIQRHDVTNGRFLEFVEAGGYRQERWWGKRDWTWVRQERKEHPLFWERLGGSWSWRGVFDRLPLPLSWPVYVTHAEAEAYARWSGARLPTEAEYQRAAFGSPQGERRFPWGAAEPAESHGVFDFSSWDPEPAGSHPAGASAWGVEDLVGNGWEWTSTPFAPFPGFRAMASYPEYSADFFDGEHYVMKGASPATARELMRPTLRNWFRGLYPYAYASFRCARSRP
jgi:ergothioneine biosynthesis protein EgtB